MVGMFNLDKSSGGANHSVSAKSLHAAAKVDDKKWGHADAHAKTDHAAAKADPKKGTKAKPEIALDDSEFGRY